MIFRPIKVNNLVFFVIIASFVVAMFFVTQKRGGKDLKVGLFGVEQVLNGRSPYDNPTDPHRAIFRYAPAYTILQYPFLLRSKLVAPFVFRDIAPSIAAWYLFEIVLVLLSFVLLYKLIPASSAQDSFNNLKLSILLALPFIGYEVSNCQNKLVALFFLISALYCFEKKKMFWSALLFNLALTVYIPLFVFIFYFVIRSRGKFILPAIAASVIIFGIIPSWVYGAKFNIFLLKDWYSRSLQPFMMTHSYATYVDLRDSSQSLPSAVGRLFVSKESGELIRTVRSFRYLLSPERIHTIIRVVSSLIMVLSILAILKRSYRFSRGLEYAIFLILAMILPQYCIYYTWAWLWVIYYAGFNYVSSPEVPRNRKRALSMCIYGLFLSSLFTGVHQVNYMSNLFWLTFILWAGIAGILLQEGYEDIKEHASPPGNYRPDFNANMSVVLIAHNEEENISSMIRGLLDAYPKEILEIIVVDDASTDKTSSIVESLRRNFDLIKLVKKGLPAGVGLALQAGFKAVDQKAGYVLTMDSDFTENIKEVSNLIRAIKDDGYDGVIGSRFIEGSSLERYPQFKKAMNRSFHRIVKSIFRIKQNDLTNNFKLYRADIFKSIPWKSAGFAMNAETGILPIISGYRIAEAPVSWKGRDLTMGKSKFSCIRHGLGYIFVIFYALYYSCKINFVMRLYQYAIFLAKSPSQNVKSA